MPHPRYVYIYLYIHYSRGRRVCVPGSALERKLPIACVTCVTCLYLDSHDHGCVWRGCVDNGLLLVGAMSVPASDWLCALRRLCPAAEKKNILAEGHAAVNTQ